MPSIWFSSVGRNLPIKSGEYASLQYAISFITAQNEYDNSDYKWISFWDANPGGGYFELNGVAQPSQTQIWVRQSDLANNLKFIGAKSSALDYIYMNGYAYDFNTKQWNSSGWNWFQADTQAIPTYTKKIWEWNKSDPIFGIIPAGIPTGYKLNFDGNNYNVDVRINLVAVPFTGADKITATTVGQWESKIEELWNGFGLKSPGGYIYPIKMNVIFTTGPWSISGDVDHNVSINGGTGRSSAVLWFADNKGEQYQNPRYFDIVTAHEFGHLIGAWDEYQDGWTNNKYTTTGTLMSDNTPVVKTDYFHHIEKNAEMNSNTSYEVVKLPVGFTAAASITHDLLL